MRVLVPFFVSLLSFSSLAADPRNAENYRVLFDLEARGESELVDGYGAYVQVYSPDGDQWIRYCDNFEGRGLNGKPNPDRARRKLLPFGSVDAAAYVCHDLSLPELARGRSLIEIGDRAFFAMQSSEWTAKEGGEILFQFAKKIPLLGKPTYRTLRVRATRANDRLVYAVEAVIPKTGIFPFRFLRFDVSGSGLGIPNGISGLTLDPGERAERVVDLDVLEGKTSTLVTHRPKT